MQKLYYLHWEKCLFKSNKHLFDTTSKKKLDSNKICLIETNHKKSCIWIKQIFIYINEKNLFDSNKHFS